MKRYHAAKKFAKISALNAEIDTGGHVGTAARRTKTKMNDTWFKRTSNNTTGFFDQKKACRLC